MRFYTAFQDQAYIGFTFLLNVGDKRGVEKDFNDFSLRNGISGFPFTSMKTTEVEKFSPLGKLKC